MVCGGDSIASSSEMSYKHIDFTKLITNPQT